MKKLGLLLAMTLSTSAIAGMEFQNIKVTKNLMTRAPASDGSTSCKTPWMRVLQSEFSVSPNGNGGLWHNYWLYSKKDQKYASVTVYVIPKDDNYYKMSGFAHEAVKKQLDYASSDRLLAIEFLISKDKKCDEYVINSLEGTITSIDPFTVTSITVRPSDVQSAMK